MTNKRLTDKQRDSGCFIVDANYERQTRLIHSTVTLKRTRSHAHGHQSLMPDNSRTQLLRIVRTVSMRTKKKTMINLYYQNSTGLKQILLGPVGQLIPCGSDRKKPAPREKAVLSSADKEVFYDKNSGTKKLKHKYGFILVPFSSNHKENDKANISMRECSRSSYDCPLTIVRTVSMRTKKKTMINLYYQNSTGLKQILLGPVGQLIPCGSDRKKPAPREKAVLSSADKEVFYDKNSGTKKLKHKYGFILVPFSSNHKENDKANISMRECSRSSYDCPLTTATNSLVVGLFAELGSFIASRGDMVSNDVTNDTVTDVVASIGDSTAKLGEQTNNQSAHPSYLYPTTLPATI
ncbi:hypothetical protein T265_01346 [Opisthorchis viverrini]|uniref:Uncharacterized protein n=1 Tax=Opisthorchis viverrini TaxID=6198 RepID=A0A074ZZ06_OPIVI|nr:hypothetical protein T265_01346 [Opisthorchis viverrini]KER32663.1 hypothetical protein T265_01346 [Opisthorchis viverrini]